MKKTIVDLIALVFILLFLYTAISKIIDYSIFKEQIATSPLLKRSASFIAWSLPVIEFFVVLLLFVPRWRSKGFLASISLMTSFTIYIIYILLFNEDIPCSCGGALEMLSWEQHIVFNCILLLLAIAGWLLQRKLYKTNMDHISTFFYKKQAM